MLVALQKAHDASISKWVLTWCGQQRASKAVLSRCCIPFINKMLVALQKAHDASISKWVVTARKVLLI